MNEITITISIHVREESVMFTSTEGRQWLTLNGEDRELADIFLSTDPNIRLQQLSSLEEGIVVAIDQAKAQIASKKAEKQAQHEADDTDEFHDAVDKATQDDNEVLF